MSAAEPGSLLPAAMLTNAYSREWFSLFLHEIDPGQTAREVAFVEQQVKPGCWMLDLPCGSGRHARLLAARGYRVIALDRALTLLGPVSGSSPIWICGDLRSLPISPGRVDAILCLWQSFGYFGPEENAEVLRQWADLVRPGGCLILDLYHRGFFEAHQGDRWFQHSRGRIRERRTMRGDRLVVELMYEGVGGGDRFEWQLYSPASLEELASRCGWRLRLACSGFDPGQPAGAEQPRVQYVLVRSTD